MSVGFTSPSYDDSTYNHFVCWSDLLITSHVKGMDSHLCEKQLLSGNEYVAYVGVFTIECLPIAQPWECFHTWTKESESASERKLFQHEQTHCVHKLAPANLSVWNYFTQVDPLKEIRLRVFTFADDVMLLQDSLTSGLPNKSERLTVQTMTDIFITVNYPKWTTLAKWLMSNDNAQHYLALCLVRMWCREPRHFFLFRLNR